MEQLAHLSYYFIYETLLEPVCKLNTEHYKSHIGKRPSIHRLIRMFLELSRDSKLEYSQHLTARHIMYYCKVM